MFAPEALQPAVDRLAELAAVGGRWSSRSAPAGSPSRSPGAECRSPASSSSRCPGCAGFRPARPAAVFRSEPGYLGLDTYDVLNQRLVSHHFWFDDDSKQARLFRSPHRYVWPAELDLMAQLAGLDLETRHADWRGAEFTADSPSHVSVYRKPADRRPAR